METKVIYEFYRFLSKDSFVLIYLGEFDDELTSILLEINEAGKTEMKSVKKKMSFLIAECFQNIVRHSDKTVNLQKERILPQMFMMRDRGYVHHLITTNLIYTTNRESLRTSLESLQNLSKEELKAIYMDAFENNDRTEKGGAGLGLIEMARKGGLPPSFDFVEVNDTYSNFFMQANILAKDFVGTVEPNDINLKSAKTIYNLMNEHHVVLVQKGDFSQEAVVPLIQLFENNLNLKSEHITVAKKVLYLLIEMLQNITRHGEKIDEMKEGIFYICDLGNSCYEINTGNFVSIENGILLKNQLDSIADLDKIELAKKYKEQLLNETDEDGKGAGIGLIEICRNCTERINYDVQEINDKLSFFSLHVKI